MHANFLIDTFKAKNINAYSTLITHQLHAFMIKRRKRADSMKMLKSTSNHSNNEGNSSHN